MKQMQIACAAALALAVIGGPAAAQITIMPAGPGGEPIQMPGPGRELKTGTGRIAGRLVTADTGAPVRRAQVRLSGSDILPKSVTTDTEGRYEFRDLPAGRFTLSATKSGYVTISYGQTRPFEAGKPIELAEGQVVDRADLVMPRGSVISGRIVDEFGEPVAEAVVTAMRSTWQNGRRRLQSAGRTATTNDLGQFRIYGLPPGEYYVSSTVRGAQEMIVAEMAVAMSVRTTVNAGDEAPRSGYAPTYYPGTPSPTQAQKILVGLGQEAQNTDFALVPVRLARVSGTVIGSDGRPLEGIMVSTAPRNAMDGVPLALGGTARTDRNGNFTMTGVAPGEYTLSARSTITMTSVAVDRTMFTTRTVAAASGEAQQEFGSVPLSVAGDDVANVIVVTSKGTSVSGRVVYEGGSKPNVNTLRISAASPDADGPMGLLGGSSSVTADGTFEIRGVAGPRIFRVMNVPAGWVLKAIRYNGSDITDAGLDVRGSEPLTGLEVVLTTRGTEITGTVKQGNEPATDYTVVVFSDDPQKWTVPMTRHIATARPNQEGRFQLKNLPAGSYYAVALDYIAQGDWFDPEVLERLKTRATRLTLDEGQVETLDLRLESGAGS